MTIPELIEQQGGIGSTSVILFSVAGGILLITILVSVLVGKKESATLSILTVLSTLTIVICSTAAAMLVPTSIASDRNALATAIEDRVIEKYRVDAAEITDVSPGTTGSISRDWINRFADADRNPDTEIFVLTEDGDRLLYDVVQNPDDPDDVDLVLQPAAQLDQGAVDPKDLQR